MRNADVRESLAEYVETQREEKEILMRQRAEQERVLQARRYHYMRSTYQINGVFASPWFPQNEFEKLLTSVKPLSTRSRTKILQSKTDVVHDMVYAEPPKLPPVKNPPRTKGIQGTKFFLFVIKKSKF